MIDAKRAVQIAKEKAADMLNQPLSSLEEIERESYKGREVWSITLSVPPDPSQPAAFAMVAILHYKRFLIDAETGELVAIKLREVASQ